VLIRHDPEILPGKVKEDGMVALLCGCGRRLEADEEEQLCGRVSVHLEEDHHASYVDRGVVRGMVASRGYKLERAVVYANGTAPDEEFGPEPY
jgi:hypothetical protein